MMFGGRDDGALDRSAVSDRFGGDLGASLAGLANPKNEPLHLLAEIGVVIMLFEIGLETDLQKLLAVGGAAAAVALIGVLLQVGLGYGICKLLGLADLAAVVAWRLSYPRRASRKP